MWSSFGSAPPPDTTGGLVGIIESSTRYRWSAGTSQRPDRSRGKGWGRGCELPAEACPGYALHNLCYTKLILALFRASVKFHGRNSLRGSQFPDVRILQHFGAIFPEKRSWRLFSLTSVYSCEYTSFATVLSPTLGNDLPLVELCRVRRGSCSLAVAFWGCVVLVGVGLLLCEDICQKGRGTSHLPRYRNQCRPRHRIQASYLILCYYVKLNRGCTALDGNLAGLWRRDAFT